MMLDPLPDCCASAVSVTNFHPSDGCVAKVTVTKCAKISKIGAELEELLG